MSRKQKRKLDDQSLDKIAGGAGVSEKKGGKPVVLPPSEVHKPIKVVIPKGKPSKNPGIDVRVIKPH